MCKTNATDVFQLSFSVDQTRNNFAIQEDFPGPLVRVPNKNDSGPATRDTQWVPKSPGLLGLAGGSLLHQTGGVIRGWGGGG